ncbi:MAG: caspase family protein [Rhizobiaceae bacterium]|nr:caspase family protein [Rhizobiaceae bacterium]
MTKILISLILMLSFGASIGSAAAQQTNNVALIIGNSAYINHPELANPVNDAIAMSIRLKELGFDVISVTDGDRAGIYAALSEFGTKASGADVALLFYAGHGVQVSGRNWLLPVSANIKQAGDLAAQAVRTDDILEVMDSSGASLKLIILDACRNNPLPVAASRGVARGLARVEARTAGTMIAFATAPDQTAEDGAGTNSPFTTALLQHISTPGLEVRQMFGRVRQSVYEATGKKQLPWVNEAILGEYYFGGRAPNAVIPPIAEKNPTVENSKAGLSEEVAFELAREINTIKGYEAFLTQFPSGSYAGFATALSAKAAKPVSSPQKFANLRKLEKFEEIGFLFPDSSERKLSSHELIGLSKKELRIARNEIYARRGRFFKSKDLQRHFGQFDWYQPFTWKPRLNSIEKANVRLVQRAEK